MSIYTTLINNTDVTDIVGENIHTSQAPDNAQAPYIILEHITGTPENYTDEPPDADYLRVAIKCIGNTQVESISLYKKTRTALALIGYEKLRSDYGEFDKSTKLYLTTFDFSNWENR